VTNKNTRLSKCLSKFLFLFQICDVVQMVIIHKDVFAKFGDIQNMKVEKK
jgi:hypothetical protein